MIPFSYDLVNLRPSLCQCDICGGRARNLQVSHDRVLDLGQNGGFEVNKGRVPNMKVIGGAQKRSGRGRVFPSRAQERYLSLGLRQPGGKLPLFDSNGQRIAPRTIQACMEAGWAKPWHQNPIQPDWLVCRLTERGREVIEDEK
jgi:hypothetical protein